MHPLYLAVLIEERQRALERSTRRAMADQRARRWPRRRPTA